MRILVNDEPLNFEIQERLSVAEAIDKVRTWAEGQGHFVIDYRIAALPEFADSEALMTDQVELIDITLGDQRDLVETNLRDLIDYSDRMGYFLAKAISEGRTLDDKEQASLIEACAFMDESIMALLSHLAPENKQDLSQAVKDLKNQADLVLKINALAIIKNQIQLWLRSVEFSRIDSSEAENKLTEFRSQIGQLKSDLEKIASQMTRGKEQAALQALESAMQKITDAMILMRIAEDTKKDEGKSILIILRTLTQHLDEKDWVSAADVVDFDLRDALDRLLL